MVLEGSPRTTTRKLARTWNRWRFGSADFRHSTASVFSLIALQIGIRDEIPRVDYLTRFDELTLSMTVLVFVAVGESVLTTALAMRERYDTAIQIERISRWAYLGLLIALLVIHLAL